MTGKPLVVIWGATAVGKTSLAISLCERLNGEIVSADSRQIYRYMDIGTAKATAEEQARVRHHLIDVVTPDETLTLAQYQAMAYGAIDALHEAGRVPFLVGGTGQYVTAVVEGWSIPRVAPNWALRDELEAYALEHGAEVLHGRLMALDRAYAERTHPNNIRRVIRALEVCMATGGTMTEAQRKTAPPYGVKVLGLRMEREALYRRADARVDAMMAAGFLEEVEVLEGMGYGGDLPSMSGVGYSEMVAHLGGGMGLEEAIERAKGSTHDFIRRQEVWFRGHDHDTMWHDVDGVIMESVIDDWATMLGSWIERGAL